MEMWTVKIVVYFVSALSCFILCQGQGEHNLRGRNVCENIPGYFQCCNGWKPLGDQCLIAICDGNFTCVENEVCVSPNQCRCRHGYFGPTCDMKCPPQFWGPDCKGRCSCHPNGRCDDVTGNCTCLPNRWGANCELSCGCRKGTCDQVTGACTCHAGFWGKQCTRSCSCSAHSVCDVASGKCQCNPGWFGRSCNGQCVCNGSPCEQLTARCKCREGAWGSQCERMCQCVHGHCNQVDGSCTCWPGFRGKFCREPCPAGFYGQNCRNRCGHCKGQQPCKVTEGHCMTCERGWNGTRCDQKCANGFFGENCIEVCPTCKDGHFCNRINGKCPLCNPGWTGDQCEIKCPIGTYGDNCTNECQECFNGSCHFVTGHCLCDPGFHGTLCNVSCSVGKYGVNCAQTCSCHENSCNAVSGVCNLQPNQRMGVMAAGVLVSFLLLLLLSLLCCCFISSHTNINGDSENKEKQRLFGGITRIGSKLPRVPLRRQRLPNILVSHHDPENTLNCSFIEPPSTVEQTPACSPRASHCSVETSEDSHVYSKPHETQKECKTNENALNRTESTFLGCDEEEFAMEPFPEVSSGTAGQPCLDDQSDVTCKGTPESSAIGSESACSRSQAALPPTTQREHVSIGITEKIKPRPPDPSTKPKVSWIHQSKERAPKQKGSDHYSRKH